MDHSFVLDGYRAARDRFVALAREKGARTLDAFANPGVTAPDGGALMMDVAWFGPAEAERVFLCTSGMHGLEGPAGSAAQFAWLAGGGVERLPPGVAVLMVHALNAWGFAWSARCTENNVDLNRNFLDFGHTAPPENPWYAHVGRAIRVDSFGPETLPLLMQRYEALLAELGPARLRVAANGAQYTDPEGLTYGGNGPEFGHRILRDHVLPRLGGAREVGLLDWHTGVGAYNAIAYLVTGGIESEAGRRAARWWGEDKVLHWERSGIEAAIEADAEANDLDRRTPGQFYQELPRLLPHARVTGGIIEFGTEKDGDFTNLMLGYVYERYLRFVHRGPRLDAEHKPWLDLLRNAFVPADPVWRRQVVTAGPRLMDEVIAGLAAA